MRPWPTGKDRRGIKFHLEQGLARGSAGRRGDEARSFAACQSLHSAARNRRRTRRLSKRILAMAWRIQEATMGLFSKDIKSLADLYQHGLEDLYYAENQILKALPKMIENAANAQLKQGLQQHFGDTQNQVKRLEQVFKLHNREPEGTKCPAIDGIIKEGDDLMGEVEGEDVMNVGIVAAAQAVEHYEITRYGALIAWAKEMGHAEDARILARSLDEEKAADRKLTAIAERRVNPQADHGRMRKPAAGSRKGAPAGRRRAAASSRKPTRKTQRSRKSGRA